MSRLHDELNRLFPRQAPDDAPGTVRALVLALGGPADWALLAPLWAGAQAELGLPAPAIAVDGHDALQLWWSLEAPVPAAQAQAVVAALAARYLGGVAPRRLRHWPTADALLPPAPPAEGSAGQWSAFVAPDLAPLFSETPWLDLPPGDDNQASLLAQVQRIRPAAWAALQADLAAPAPVSGMAAANPGPAHAGIAGGQGPQAFLTAVMDDAGVPLALRIEAAKALLAHLRR